MDSTLSGFLQRQLEQEFFAVWSWLLVLRLLFASAAAISSHDGARQACHGVPAIITSPSALHLA